LLLQPLELQLQELLIPLRLLLLHQLQGQCCGLALPHLLALQLTAAAAAATVTAAVLAPVAAWKMSPEQQ
jgi:hypothetical protein